MDLLSDWVRVGPDLHPGHLLLDYADKIRNPHNLTAWFNSAKQFLGIDIQITQLQHIHIAFCQYLQKCFYFIFPVGEARKRQKVERYSETMIMGVFYGCFNIFKSIIPGPVIDIIIFFLAGKNRDSQRIQTGICHFYDSLGKTGVAVHIYGTQMGIPTYSTNRCCQPLSI